MGHIEHSITQQPVTNSSIADATNTEFSNADLWFARHTGSGSSGLSLGQVFTQMTILTVMVATQLRLDDSDLGSELEQYNSSDYYVWNGGSSDSQLLFYGSREVHLFNSVPIEQNPTVADDRRRSPK